jgi:hypothetical protein
MKRLFLISLLVGFCFSASALERKAYVVEQGDTVYTMPDKSAEFYGGMDSMYHFFFTHLQHSADLDTYISPNMVLMKIKVNKAGEVLNAKIMHTFSEEYSADVVSVAEKFPIMQPAVCHGRVVASYKIIKLYFKQK